MGFIQKRIIPGIDLYTCQKCRYEEESIISLSWCSRCQSDDVIITSGKTESWHFSLGVNDLIPGKDVENFIKGMKQLQEDDLAEKLKNQKHQRRVRIDDKN